MSLISNRGIRGHNWWKCVNGGLELSKHHLGIGLVLIETKNINSKVGLGRTLR